MTLKTCPEWLLLFGFILILTTCSDKNPTGGNPSKQNDPNTVSQDIGSAGGSIISSDGLLELNFPAGALGSTETITITPIDPEDLGPEFDEVVNEFGANNAYDLGPDGLSFDKPVGVTYHSDQVVTQEGDSVSVAPAFLFTNEGDEAVAMDSLQLSVDKETGSVSVYGELHHFTDMVYSANYFDQVAFVVIKIPDHVLIDQLFTVMGSIASRSYNHTDAMYIDLSEQPIHRDFEPANQVMPNHDELDFSFGSYVYTCTQPGTGTYKAGATLILNTIVQSVHLDDDVNISGLIVEKQIECLIRAPKLKSPANEAMGVELQTTLEWESVNGATSYTVQLVEEGKEFSDEEAAEVEVMGISAEASGLKLNTTYKWRVRTNNDNDGSVSDWSEVWTFTTGGDTTEKTANLALQKTCVDHNVEKAISWVRKFILLTLTEGKAAKSTGIGFLMDDLTEYTVTEKFTLPDDTEEEINYSPDAKGNLYSEFEIHSYGHYDWEITDVMHNGESIPFTGDTGGEVNVTSKEQNPGECTP